MATITMATDSTSLILNGFPIVDFAEGDYLELKPVSPLTSQINAAAGGVNIIGRNDGGVKDLVVRVQKASSSDVFLNSTINQAAPVVFNGSAKEDFVRDGVAGAETYILESGSQTILPSNVKSNTDGNAMMEYTIRFRNATRSL